MSTVYRPSAPLNEKLTGGACVANAGGGSPRDRRGNEIDAMPWPDPPSTAVIAIVVAEETNAGGNVGAPKVSVLLGTNGAQAFCWFDQYGATRKLAPSSGSTLGSEWTALDAETRADR